MKTLNDLFSTKKSSTSNTNKLMFEILKSEKKFTRNELKIELFKIKFELEHKVVYNDKFIEDDKYKKSILELAKTTRNTIDTFVSKNNHNNLFVDFGINEKMQFQDDKYFLIVNKK